MMWVCLTWLFMVLSLQSLRLLRQRLWADLLTQITLLGAGVGFGTAISFGWWEQVDLLAPVKFVFTPLTNWIYALF